MIDICQIIIFIIFAIGVITILYSSFKFGEFLESHIQFKL